MSNLNNTKSENFINLKIRLPLPLQSWFIFILTLTWVLAPLAIILLIIRYSTTKKILHKTEQRINEMIPPEYRTVQSLQEIISNKNSEIDKLNKSLKSKSENSTNGIKK